MEINTDQSWNLINYNDALWVEALAPYGNEGIAATTWKTDDLWFRKKFI